MAVSGDFLPELFRGTKGLIYFCALRNSKSKLPLGEVAHILTRNINDIKSFREKWDRPEYECGIYYHVATLKPGAARRIKQNCLHFISLFSDVDDANHELSRDIARALLEQAECPPTLIVDSGHGLQPYWLLTEPCNDADRIEQARKAIQNITASDSVADAARVMRLVGSHNSKKGNGEWLSVDIISHNPERIASRIWNIGSSTLRSLFRASRRRRSSRSQSTMVEHSTPPTTFPISPLSAMPCVIFPTTIARSGATSAWRSMMVMAMLAAGSGPSGAPAQPNTMLPIRRKIGARSRQAAASP